MHSLLPGGHDQHVSLVIIYFQSVVSEEVGHDTELLGESCCQLLRILACDSVGAVICITAEAPTVMALHGKYRCSSCTCRRTICLMHNLGLFIGEDGIEHWPKDTSLWYSSLKR